MQSQHQSNSQANHQYADGTALIAARTNPTFSDGASLIEAFGNAPIINGYMYRNNRDYDSSNTGDTDKASSNNGQTVKAKSNDGQPIGASSNDAQAVSASSSTTLNDPRKINKSNRKKRNRKQNAVKNAHVHSNN